MSFASGADVQQKQQHAAAGAFAAMEHAKVETQAKAQAEASARAQHQLMDVRKREADARAKAFADAKAGHLSAAAADDAAVANASFEARGNAAAHPSTQSREDRAKAFAEAKAGLGAAVSKVGSWWDNAASFVGMAPKQNAASNPSSGTNGREELMSVRQREAEARARAFAEAKEGQLTANSQGESCSLGQLTNGKAGGLDVPGPVEGGLLAIRQQEAQARAKAFAEARQEQLAVQKTKVVHFRVKVPCEEGNRVLLCGSVEQLGEWNPKAAVPLQRVAGDTWCADIAINENAISSCEFKVIVRDPNGTISWETGPNQRIGRGDEPEAKAEPLIPAVVERQPEQASSAAMPAALDDPLHGDRLMLSSVNRNRDSEARAKAFAEAKAEQMSSSSGATAEQQLKAEQLAAKAERLASSARNDGVAVKSFDEVGAEAEADAVWASAIEQAKADARQKAEAEATANAVWNEQVQEELEQYKQTEARKQAEARAKAFAKALVDSGLAPRGLDIIATPNGDFRCVVL